MSEKLKIEMLDNRLDILVREKRIDDKIEKYEGRIKKLIKFTYFMITIGIGWIIYYKFF